MLEPTRRLHHSDTYLLEFEARVLARRAAGQDVEVALDQSAFYVESGGQPADRGWLQELEVSGLSLEDGVVWHRLADGRAAEAFPEGALVAGKVDEATRRDHMQQHTAQHILSQAFLLCGGRNTRGFHLGDEYSTVDFDGEKPDADLRRKSLALANDCVLRNRPLRIHWVAKEDLGRIPLRRDPQGDRDLLRVIEIEGFDWSACGGTHAHRTGEVGAIHILGVEKVRDLWRIRFLAGRRTINYFAEIYEELNSIAMDHSVGYRDLAAHMGKRRAEIQEAERRLRYLLQRLAIVKADALLAARPASTVPEVLGIWLEEDEFEMAQDLCQALAERRPCVVLLASPGEDTIRWLIARSRALEGRWKGFSSDTALRGLLRDYGGRGGGSAIMARGMSPTPSDSVKTSVDHLARRYCLPDAV